MEWQVRRGVQGRVMLGTVLEGEEFACAFCKGTGVVAKARSQCPVCSGQGSVRVTAPAVLCAYCRGRGEVPLRSGITCTVCRGKGAVSVREPIQACPACRGRGATGGGHLPCTTCQGKGVVTVRGR
jgi:DnaJ-class molecular chaperone